jgi:hypothetical protein
MIAKVKQISTSTPYHSYCVCLCVPRVVRKPKTHSLISREGHKCGKRSPNAVGFMDSLIQHRAAHTHASPLPLPFCILALFHKFRV